ncbi:MAG: hypothetical protein HRF48_13545, partial [Chloroflexota bacterium]
MVESRRLQRAMIAALMIGLFMCSMALAYWLSESRPPPFRRMSLSGLTLIVPNDWQQDPSLEPSWQERDVSALMDPTHQDRRLLIAPAPTPVPVSPIELVEQALKVFLSPQELQSLQQIPVPPPQPLGYMGGYEYVGISRTPQEGVKLHLLAALTVEGRSN